MKKIKHFFNNDFPFIAIIFIFSSIISFYLGKFSVEYKNNISLKKQNYFLELKRDKEKTIKLIASSKGKTYSYPWCSGAKRISEKNKIIFNSKKEAEQKGYREAKNCEGF